jgi:anti-anti-sigma factor
MDIAEVKQNGIVILGLQGRLDASNAGALENRVISLIDAGDRRFVIDCAGLDYISSAGLRVFLLTVKRLKTDGGKMALAALNAQIKEVFDIAGFSSIFTICGSQAQAVAAVE